jgi:hypothetical protein
VIKLCSLRVGREGVRTCLTRKYRTLSENCREEILSAVAKRAGKASALPARAQAMSYGTDPAQVLDFWPASKSPNAGRSPLIVFVHGGGWKRGSKDNATGRLKPEHYPSQGYAFASINYRLVPAATVEQQAADAAAALKALCARADVDPRRLVLMGHSAGAHLVDRIAGCANISVHFRTQAEAIMGSETVQSVRVRNSDDGTQKDIACAGFFGYIGLEPACEFAPAAVQRDTAGFLVTDTAMQTAMTGLFAAGAVRSGYSGMLADATAEGIAAANSARALLRG